MFSLVMKRTNALFNNKTVRTFLLKLRYPIFIIIGILLTTWINPDFFVAGCMLSLTGALIQFWCFGSLKKHKILADKGLYMLVRNPMYLGRYFLLCGFLLLTGNVWLMLVFTVVYYFYMVNRVKREESNLCKVFGEAYNDYCRDVKQFVPSFKRFNRRSFWYFKWKICLENNGHWNLASVLFIYAVLYFFYSA